MPLAAVGRVGTTREVGRKNVRRAATRHCQVVAEHDVANLHQGACGLHGISNKSGYVTCSLSTFFVSCVVFNEFKVFFFGTWTFLETCFFLGILRFFWSRIFFLHDFSRVLVFFFIEFVNFAPDLC